MYAIKVSVICDFGFNCCNSVKNYKRKDLKFSGRGSIVQTFYCYTEFIDIVILNFRVFFKYFNLIL